MDNAYKKASADYSRSYAEYLVERKPDKNIILARAGIILLEVILILALLVVVLNYNPFIGAVALLLILFVGVTLWRKTAIEYEYLIVSGELSMDRINGQRKRKHIAEFDIKTADSIAPLCDTNLDGANVIFAASSLSDEDVYCAVYKDEKGNKTALIFNVYDKALELLHYYNKATVIKK